MKKCTKKRIVFQFLILLLDQIILYVSERILQEEYKNYSQKSIDYKITDEKLQYSINRKAANISPLSSGKIDKYEFLTGEEILSLDQRRLILAESNQLIKKDFNINRDSIPLNEQKKMFNKFVEEKSYEFRI